ncbi:MAG: DUF285 domain-containing protein [Paludibacteraceae bacterium]|nr:DUF285 domain-containing protein [Paludibacteraceae bacterium]
MKQLFSLLAVLWIVAMGTVKAAENEIYAVYSTDGQTMTLYYDNQRAARSGVTDWFYYDDLPRSEKDRLHAVKTVVLDISMKKARPTSTKRWFFNYNITKIEHLEYLNTENVTTMAAMFSVCHSLKEVDVSTFNTKNVTDMNCMFAFSMELESVDVRNFDMQRVNETSCMFAYCTELTTILCDDDWSKYSKIYSSGMFFWCEKLAGGKGTRYNAEITDMTYARPDGGTGNPGYFTEK